MVAQQESVQQWIDALERQGRTVRKQNGYWMAQCPAHPDNNPSLQVKENDRGGAAVTCYAGCEYVDILKAIGFYGNWPSTARKPRGKRPRALPSGRNDTLYYYHHADGVIAFVVVRRDKKDGSKTFSQWTPKGDQWLPVGLAGGRPIYCLLEIQTGTEPVRIVEGEKCVQACRRAWAGVPVTTWAGGTNSWRQTDWSPLAGRAVRLIADGDEPGHKAMTELAAHLHELGCAVRLCLPPQDGTDIADWLERGADYANAVLQDNLTDYAPPAPAPEAWPDWELQDPTALGDAWRLIKAHGDKLLVVNGEDQAYALDVDTGIWSNNEDLLRKLHADTSKEWGAWAGVEYQNGNTTVRQLLDHLRKSRNATGVQQAVKMMGAAIRKMNEAGIPHLATYVNAAELDANQRYLGCANGVVDLDAGELLDVAAGAEKLITRSTGIPYTPGARHAAIDGLLNHLPRVERDYLLDAAAYSLRGNPARRWYVLAGPPGSGKSTFLSAIAASLGECANGGYSFALQEGALLKDRHVSPGSPGEHKKFFPVGRFAHSAELPGGSAGFNEGLLRSLTGGDPISVRELYQKTGPSRPARATIFLTLNDGDLARLSLVDAGLHDRTAILPWPSFPADTVKDVDRVNAVTLAPAAEAMLEILINRCRRLKAPPPIPASVASATADRRRESIGPLGQWLEQRVRITGNRRDYMVPEKLWDAAKESFALDTDNKIHGYDRPSALRLLKEVYPNLPRQKQKRIEGYTKRPYVYEGVKLLAAEDVEDALVCRLCGGPPNGPELSEDGLCAKCLLDVESGRKWIELGFLPVWDSVPPEARGNTLGTPPDASYAFLEGAYQALRDAVVDNRLPEEQIPLLEPIVVDR